MRSAKLVAPRQIQIFEDRMPLPTEGEVLVRVRAAGICGSDLHIYQGERSDVALPRILGQELVGEVESVGSGVSRFSRGDRVTVDPVVSCGKCVSCRRGYDNSLQHRQMPRSPGGRGLLRLHRRPRGKGLRPFPGEWAGKRRPLSNPSPLVAEVLARSEAGKGDKVLVIGAGPSASAYCRP